MHHSRDHHHHHRHTDCPAPAPTHVLRGTALALALSAASVAWSMDLRQAYEAAAAADAAMRASRAAAQATHERIAQAQAQRRPNLSFNAGYNRNDLESTTPNFLGKETTSQRYYGSHSLTLSLRQPLYRPALQAQLRQAQAQVDNADALVETDEQSLVMRVGQTYFEALQSREQWALIQEQKAIHTTQVEAAQSRWQAGTGVRTDVDEAQARLDMTIAQELEAGQSQAYFLHKLHTMTGQIATTLQSLDTARFTPQAPVPSSVEDWIARAHSASTEIKALQAQKVAAQAEIDKAKAGHLPTVDAVAQLSRTESDTVTSVNSRYYNKSIGVQLNVPLYAGGYVSSTVREALALQERVGEQLQATQLDLALRVRTEHRNMTEGVLRIHALEQAVRSAQQMVLSNRESFKAGVRTTLDILNAEQQKMVALRDLAQARHAYALARLRLYALAGEDKLANVQAVNAWLLPTTP